MVQRYHRTNGYQACVAAGCMFALNDELIAGWWVYSLGATVRVLQVHLSNNGE
jgi:hypothetical protein